MTEPWKPGFLPIVDFEDEDLTVLETPLDPIERATEYLAGCDPESDLAGILSSLLRVSQRSKQENDEALDVIRELRQKLALAGVEGSSPPFETTIGRLERELGVEKFKLARLIEAAEANMADWTNVKTRDKLRSCLMNIYESEGKTS